MSDANRPAFTCTPEFRHDLLNRLGAARMGTELTMRNPALPESLKKNLQRTLDNLLKIQVMLQIDPSLSEEPSSTDAETGKKTPDPVQKKTASILVIDDSEDLRFLFMAVLKPRGFDVHVASNEAETWQVLATHPAPALILLDYGLGARTGSELLDELQIRHPQVFAQSRIVLFTGYGDLIKEPRAHAIERKSIDLDSITKLVQKYI